MLEALFLAVVPLFVVVDPFASLALFLGLTNRHTPQQRRRIAARAALFATGVLVVFAIVGRELLHYVGIQLYSLQTAGGILLTIIGLNMLKEGEEPGHHDAMPVATGGTYNYDQGAKSDPSFVPLGLPMLAGPGAISLVILQTTNFGLTVIGLAIGITMGAALLILLLANRAQAVIGENGSRVITRIMGILTVAFAVQYVFDGITGWLAAN
jgi:multiple antibiotic resistance protein